MSATAELEVTYAQFLEQLSEFDSIIQLGYSRILGRWRRQQQWRAYVITDMAAQLVNTDLGQGLVSPTLTISTISGEFPIIYDGSGSTDFPVKLNSVNNSVTLGTTPGLVASVAAGRLAVGVTAVQINGTLTRELYCYNAGATSIDIGPSGVTSGGGFGLPATPVGPLHGHTYAISNMAGGSVGYYYI